MEGSLKQPNTGNVSALAPPTNGALAPVPLPGAAATLLHSTPIATSAHADFGTRPLSASSIADSASHGLARPPAFLARQLHPGAKPNNTVQASEPAAASRKSVNNLSHGETPRMGTPSGRPSAPGPAPPGGTAGSSAPADKLVVGKPGKNHARGPDMLSGASTGGTNAPVPGKSGKKRVRDAETPGGGPARPSGGEQPGGRGPGGLAPADARAPVGGEGAAPLSKSAKKRAREEARMEAGPELAAEARQEGDGLQPADARAPDGEEAAAPLSKSAKKRARQAARAEATGNGPTTAPVLSLSKMEAAGAGPTVASVPSLSKTAEGDVGPDANLKKRKKQKRVPDGSVADAQGPGAERDRRQDAAGRGDPPGVAGGTAKNGNGVMQTLKGQDLGDATLNAGAGGVHAPGAGANAPGKKGKKDRGGRVSASVGAVPSGDPGSLREGGQKGKKKRERESAPGPAEGDTLDVARGSGSEVEATQGTRVASGDVPGGAVAGRKEKKRKKASTDLSTGGVGRTADLSQGAMKPNSGQQPAEVAGGGALQNGKIDLGTNKKKKNKPNGID
jgi:hypothetical protein